MPRLFKSFLIKRYGRGSTGEKIGKKEEEEKKWRKVRQEKGRERKQKSKRY